MQLRRSRSFKVTDFGTNRKLIYYFLLVINGNLPPILHRFCDIAVDRSEIAIFGYPSLCLTPPAEGFPWDYLREIFSGCQWMANVPNAVEIIAKNLNRLSRAHERYRDRRVQTTLGRAIAYSESECEFTFTKNHLYRNSSGDKIAHVNFFTTTSYM